MSGAAINTIIALRFEQKRRLAVSLALNGARCGAFIVAFLMFLTAHFGLAHGLFIAVGMILVVL
jgi:hypothetical protein